MNAVTIHLIRVCKILARGTVSALLLLAMVPTCFATSQEQSPSKQEEWDRAVDFTRDIKPILSNRCFACHGPDEEDRAADLRLDTQEGALEWVVEPGDSEASELYLRITSDDEDLVMPPPGKGDRLTTKEAKLFATWINQGAAYERHWSYVKPVRQEVPAGIHPVDHFIGRRLAEEGLTYAAVADRPTIARRLSLDLTGLPPTVEEVDGFVADRSPNAYEKYVDRMLANDAFGEHWARMWLDLARYADSAGYADDVPRTIWAFRDYVIRSFNENKPFDQFTIEQLAGDLLPDATEAQLVATAFHRNTQTNNEGGTNDEEFRNVAVVDRVNTTFATWMGTTMACAQCHTHKYDPITHAEYYQAFAILNQTQDADKRDERPTLAIYSKQQQHERKELAAQIEELKEDLRLLHESPEFATELAIWEAKLGSTRWEPLQLSDLEATSGADLTVQSDASVLATGNKSEVETYAFSAASPFEQVTAIRLELLADERLPNNGPGRGPNLVLNEISVVADAKSENGTQRGRFVRLELPGKNRLLHLAEVQVFAGEKNVALDGSATQSTTYRQASADRAIDGNTDGDYASNSVSHTGNGDSEPWWELDLGAEHDLTRIVIWNRTDNGLQQRLNGFRLSVLDEQRRPVLEKTFEKAPERELAFALDGGQTAVFTDASASFEQSGFGVAEAIDGDRNKDSGWGIAGGAGSDHHAVFPLAKPLAAKSLRLRLEQTYPNHPIGRFRVSVTDAIEPVAAVPDDIASIAATPVTERTKQSQQRLAAYYAKVGDLGKRKRRRMAALQREFDAIKPKTTVPVLREVAQEKQRETHIHLRGSYLNHGDAVQAGFPVSLAPAPETDAAITRLTLARWLVDENNPLTPRVVANRYWEKIFGIGIVATSEEFGSQGELPSHPELLDWLAIEFRESGWNTKAFLKLLVTSRAYQQSSNVTDTLAERDPANRLLARGPRVRLSAEMVRDQALAVSGLLSRKMFGPPVRPPQPDMGLKAAFGSGIDWKTSEGEDRFRRGIYTNWRRSNPYPSMATFDAPNREVCTVRRDRTNTPLQALVTLNDPVYIEAAQSLARRMLDAGDSPNEHLRFGVRLCLSRSPSNEELERLVAFYEQTLQRYTADQELANKMATDPIGPLPAGSDAPELASLTLTANVLLNLDEMLMKR
ncbi:MAG: DUF1553 domain-containing protein [Planctomycetota bacterium]